MTPSFSFVLLVTAAACVHAASLRSLQRTTRAPSTTTSTTSAAAPTSWSKRTANTPDPESPILPFVTSRVERVPRPEKIHKRKSSRVAFNAPSGALRSENSIDHGGQIPSKRKPKQQSGSRRWSGGGGGSAIGSYDPFGNGGGTSDAFYRQPPGKHAPSADGSYHRGVGFDPTASVRSPTMSVTIPRYKIIDMGDPWARWPSSTTPYGYDPHGRRPPDGETGGQVLYRPEISSYRVAPLYGYRQQQFGADGAAAYSDLEESVVDPFRQYAAGDSLPWSVQVGTSLTVKDDGRQSRRRFYVRSQKNPGYDDFRG